jgi:hypothetical protein
MGCTLKENVICCYGALLPSFSFCLGDPVFSYYLFVDYSIASIESGWLDPKTDLKQRFQKPATEGYVFLSNMQAPVINRATSMKEGSSSSGAVPNDVPRPPSPAALKRPAVLSSSRFGFLRGFTG